MVKYVIVGTDTHLSFKKICLASQYINQNGAKLLGTNIDRTDGKGRQRPSGGSCAKIIETASGTQDVQIIGKPDILGFNLIRE
jgi:HAD superfamily hydrolase (TIGR01450 family)